jgi:hypothetical protein
MAETASSIPPASTFVIRFWCEWSVNGSRWRGHIEHVQSGTSVTCLDLQEIVGFVQRYGIMVDGPDQHTSVRSCPLPPSPPAYHCGL